MHMAAIQSPPRAGAFQDSRIHLNGHPQPPELPEHVRASREPSKYPLSTLDPLLLSQKESAAAGESGLRGISCSG